MSFTYTPLDKLFPKRGTSYEFNPGKIRLTIEFSDIAQEILDTEIRSDDTWVISFPRAGQTWCQEIVWLIRNNLDFQLAQSINHHLRTPKIEHSAYMNDMYEMHLGEHSVKYFKNRPSPRTVRTHLPYDLLPTQIKTVKPKIIYVARNPKDVWCSYHKYSKACHNLDGEFEESAVLFTEGKLPFGCMIDHALTFWNRRNDSNILFIMYEDMRFNTKNVIRLIASFLEKLLTADQVDAIYEHVKIENMRNNPSVNMEWFLKKIGKDKEYAFIGEGLVGGWKKEMSPEISKIFDEWVQRKTKDTDLKYRFS